MGVYKNTEPNNELAISDNDSVQKEPEIISEKESVPTDGEASKKRKQWIYCDVFNYKCKSDNILKKHIMTKHE